MRRKAAPASFAPQSCTVTVASADGVIAFKLGALAGGLLVERSQVRASTGRITQSMGFDDPSSFIRWCDADRLRFAYPLLFANLKRSGCALFRETP